MRKLIVQEFITIDGFAAKENNSLDFMPQAADAPTENSVEQHQWQFMDSIDTVLVGRNTYELFAAYWPEAKERIASKLNALHKFVCTTTLKDAPWGRYRPAAVIHHEIPGRLADLKKQPGKHIVVWGSLQLVHSLVPTGLIDEYQLIICPFVIGRGKPLFPPTANRSSLRLAGAKTMDGSYVLLRYEVSL